MVIFYRNWICSNNIILQDNRVFFVGLQKQVIAESDDGFNFRVWWGFGKD